MSTLKAEWGGDFGDAARCPAVKLLITNIVGHIPHDRDEAARSSFGDEADQ
jgi:hypothetical protein